MEEMDASVDKKLQENSKEKDINKIQANIFKKEKVIKDKTKYSNNNDNDKTQEVKIFNKKNNKASSGNRNLKFQNNFFE